MSEMLPQAQLFDTVDEGSSSPSGGLSIEITRSVFHQGARQLPMHYKRNIARGALDQALRWPLNGNNREPRSFEKRSMK